MLIGVPKEIKDYEFRIGVTPAIARILVESGHTVKVEKDAGKISGYSDQSYLDVGAQIVDSAKDVYQSELVVKVKEPIAQEYELLQEGQVLFCFLHLAAEKALTQVLIDKNITAIAYETVTDRFGHLPLLMPMSEIAGRISIQVGATHLQIINGGKGILLGGVPGVQQANVVIIGGGAAGTEAARMAMGLEAKVTVIDNNIQRLRTLDMHYGTKLQTIYSTKSSIEEALIKADLVIGSVLIPGKVAPKLVSREMIQNMSTGSVIVDVAIDQGGCTETSKPTTHSKPTYIVNGVIHYCVTNMPGACSRTATQALTHATTEHIANLADHGYQGAFQRDVYLKEGLNVYQGKVTNKNVAEDLGYDYYPLANVGKVNKDDIE